MLADSLPFTPQLVARHLAVLAPRRLVEGHRLGIALRGRALVDPGNYVNEKRERI